MGQTIALFFHQTNLQRDIFSTKTRLFVSRVHVSATNNVRDTSVYELRGHGQGT
jgi:hypothetical protein